MKKIVFLFLVLLIGFGGFFGYTSFMQRTPPVPNEIPSDKAGVVTVTGVVQKLTKPGDDYTHMLRTSTGMIKLNSYTVKLDDFVDKTVTIEGQYSGNTLFVDAVKQ